MLQEGKAKWMLKSVDLFGKHLELISLHKKQEGESTFYEYESRLGNCQVEVCSSKGTLLLERAGEDRIHLEFALAQGGQMFFTTAFYEQIFPIEALALEEGEHFLNFSYRILDQGEVVNEIHIQMKRREET